MMMQVELQISSASISDRGLSEKRPQNEDSYLELRESGLFAVADGVGGAQAGDVASQMAMEILAEAFINLQEDGDAESRMRQAIERANSAIFQMSHDLPQLSSMATTVVALHINGNVATVGHVGDSRLYKLDPFGELTQETLDHSVVEEEVRAGRMSPEEAAIHPSRNVISRALGAEPLVDIDLKTIMIEPNTMFLACSDGVTRHIEDGELRELLINAPDEMSLCQTIKDICYERGAEDNLTAVVVRAESQFPEGFEMDGGVAEDEEETIATARHEEEPEVVEVGAPFAVESAEAPAEQPEPAVAAFAGEEAASDEAAAIAADTDSESISMTSSNSQSFLSILSDGSSSDDGGNSVSSDEEVAAKSGSFGKVLGRIFAGIVLLALGAAVGAAGYHFWTVFTQPEPVAQLEPVPTEQISVPTFEQTKAKVYEDPVASIATLSANPRNAEDYYFLGLAYLLNERYDEAAVALTNASERLPDYEEAQRDNLAKEIALARSVVTNPAARTAFAESLKAAENAAQDANSSTGVQ
ncbi:MAG: protein phosphatase 2C domain-containing protein [Acidobacteriota bacterium]|nr:MAG: protein phosphatase 2C domain-containing protein [Acidobacteriota bacterium]